MYEGMVLVVYVVKEGRNSLGGATAATDNESDPMCLPLFQILDPPLHNAYLCV